MKDNATHDFLNLRRLIGILLTFYGIVIGGYGLIKGPQAKSTSFNLDLWWGILILIVGIVFLLLSTRQPKTEDEE